jgi:hypothetical protein
LRIIENIPISAKPESAYVAAKKDKCTSSTTFWIKEKITKRFSTLASTDTNTT